MATVSSCTRGRPAAPVGRRPARVARAAALILLAAVYPLVVGFGDSPEGRNRKGNALYRKGEFDQALTEYRSAQVLAPELSALSFNAGDALFRKGDLAGAVREFAKASGATDSLLSSSAYYNAGNALVKAGDPKAAIEAYKASLKRNPADPDAKYNLELALKLLEQQQQDQKDRSQSDQKQQDQQQQDQKTDENKQNEQNQQDQPSEGQEGQENPEQAQQQPSEQEPAMSKEDAARLLDAIQQSEQELQQELRAVAKKRTKVDKDW
jgi:Ca-activated chloride channel family protein